MNKLERASLYIMIIAAGITGIASLIVGYVFYLVLIKPIA